MSLVSVWCVVCVGGVLMATSQGCVVWVGGVLIATSQGCGVWVDLHIGYFGYVLLC